MTKQHKATPDEWAQQEDWANRNAFSDSSCIIELRDRLEALEATQQPRAFTGQVVAPITNQAGPGVALYLDPSERQHGVTSDRLIARDTPAPASPLVERVATDAELYQVYNDTPEHGFGPALRAVYDLGREHGAAPIRSGPESPLVERVADAIAAQATSAGIVNDRPACAAILVVAAALLDWWDSDEVARTGWEAAKWLEQEANR
jgi:hypothetical protein